MLIDASNGIISHESLEKIFNSKQIVEYSEFCRYNFLILSYIFLKLMSDSQDIASEFKLFFLVRDEDVVKKFYKRLNSYLKNNNTHGKKTLKNNS